MSHEERELFRENCELRAEARARAREERRRDCRDMAWALGMAALTLTSIYLSRQSS